MFSTQNQRFKDYREFLTLAVLSLFCHLNPRTLKANHQGFPWLARWLFQAAIAITA